MEGRTWTLGSATLMAWVWVGRVDRLRLAIVVLMLILIKRSLWGDNEVLVSMKSLITTVSKS